MDLLRTRVSGAMDAGAAAMPSAYAPPASVFAHAAESFAPSGTPARRVSMAETLQTTFGSAEHLGSRAAQRVGEAYGKFRAFGL
jgi:hypothetical protein